MDIGIVTYSCIGNTRFSRIINKINVTSQGNWGVLYYTTNPNNKNEPVWIEDCLNFGNFSTTKTADIYGGGLIGQNDGKCTLYINRCANFGSFQQTVLSGARCYFGGIGGDVRRLESGYPAYKGAFITDCYNAGNIIAQSMSTLDHTAAGIVSASPRDED